ncbi:sulfatase-like hydrolase/transferase [Haloferula sp.]|uniref:sulfatase-like hydrolase/transferase n=1 Tax=Haloferula sp. TaxID=2497595 RepID=UPI00329FE599
MTSRTLFSLVLAMAAASNLQASNVYQDEFTGASISTVWNNEAGSPVTLDDPNNQLDYNHAAGTSRRFLSFNPTVLTGQTGYIKAAISNYSGTPSVWFGFVGANPANNANYAQTRIESNGTYEMFMNNLSTSQNFDNGAGWTGTLSPGTGVWTIDGGASEAALVVGGNFGNLDSNIRGFGFANFGNPGVFPSSSFSIDSISVDDSLTISAPGNTPPTVTISAPTDGTTVTTGTNVSFTGTATDTEDGTLDSSILWSSNLDGSLGGPAASINSSTLSIGTHTVTASVTDSGSLVGSDSIMVTVTAGNSPPIVKIHTPANRTTAASGVALNFTGRADDAIDGDLTGSMSWSSNIDGSLGTGASIIVSSLSLGEHTITASATDSGSLVGSETITVNIISTAGALRPNVIVIICDDAGYADFSFMDGLSGTTSQIPTPNLDALANRGITFSRAYVAANCQPTRAAIVTGAYQARIGNENVGDNHFLASDIFEGIPLERDTVWDRMKNLGYTTGAIGKWHLGSIEDTPTQPGNRPENQGIDQFFGFWHGSREFTAGAYSLNTSPTSPLQLRYIREALIAPDFSKTDTIKEYTDYYDKRNDPNPPPQYMTNILGDYAEDFVEQHHDDDEPFFLYVAHPAPHKPWTNESPDYNDPAISGLTPNNRRQVGSMMVTMDKEIGDLMDQLDDPNGDGDDSDSIRDNTLVVFINDNGGVAGMEMGVNGTDNGALQGVKGSAHDGGIRVPMIMAGAGIDPSKQNTVYTHPVHGIDILPTSVELAGGTLDSEADNIDGVNLVPFLNGAAPSPPHPEMLVHRWRGTAAVIDGDWKVVNTHNTNADPSDYELFNVINDIGETNDVSGSNTTRFAAMMRVLTDREAMWDKPRYPILNRDLETEPLNIINHFTFRPGIHNDWSAGVPDSVAVSSQPQNWYEGGTTNPENMFRSDGFTGAILEFPVSSSNYTANNDLRRKTGLEFMLNQIILSGDFTTGSNRTATISGLDLIFTNNLNGTGPRIDIDATEGPGGADFSYNINLDMIMYHDLTFGGDGETDLTVSGDVSQFFESRGLIKTGMSNVALTGARTYSGDTTVDEGTLTLGQVNGADDSASVHLAGSDATLHLSFGGIDTVEKLFIEGVQQPSGDYKAGSATAVPQITGPGTLRVTADPPTGYNGWADENAPGQTAEQDHDLDRVQNGIEYFMGESGSGFTALPSPDGSGTVTWTMGPDYAGTYGTDFEIESSTPGLDNFQPVPISDVVIVPGVSVSYTMPTTAQSLFIRLLVNAE